MILIIDCGSQKTSYIEQCVDEFMDFQTVSFHSLTLDHLADKKGIVFSGAPLLITEIDMKPYLDKVSWLKTIEIPVLGICFGHQLIGITYGAFGSRMKEDRDWQTIEVFEECELFNKLPTEVEMMEDHCESISIPNGFQLIASSDACVNEAMKHQTKLIFGVQFHPEVSGNHGRVLFENFISICERD